MINTLEDIFASKLSHSMRLCMTKCVVYFRDQLNWSAANHFLEHCLSVLSRSRLSRQTVSWPDEQGPPKRYIPVTRTYAHDRKVCGLGSTGAWTRQHYHCSWPLSTVWSVPSCQDKQTPQWLWTLPLHNPHRVTLHDKDMWLHFTGVTWTRQMIMVLSKVWPSIDSLPSLM
jgi:hypothetical protein